MNQEQKQQLPVFSERLDELMGAMIDGKSPNVGRFCGYCYTPLGKQADACSHCGRTTGEYEPVPKIPPDFFELYRRMRKRESLIVNSFAFAGLGIGLLAFIGLVALAVYQFDGSFWVLGLSLVVLLVGGRVMAGLLGGWIGDSVGYQYAQRKLAKEWAEYEAERERELGRVPANSASTRSQPSRAS